ncbi:phenoloxidase-activating factor 1-like [Melitaea cinxia]|uniref:phenoloxidase-activating factor 1-like n=1 Tax=Melitaea cinxia TaxID=113334 RepID=UPI001E272177|nr:phenoloxidase-activating factor 1-like [Melitaea cinxia]
MMRFWSVLSVSSAEADIRSRNAYPGILDITRQPCNEGEVTGVCRRIYECPFAIDLVNIHQKKPPTCGYDSDVKIVCCPSQGLLFRTGTFKDYFKASNDGVIRSKELTCRYEGRQPLLCCQNTPDIPEAPEPKQCPPLPKPKLYKAATQYQQFAWRKCISYQRYFNKCISSDENEFKFERMNTCGRDTSTSQFRISEGVPALPREFPHMAVIGCHNPVYTDDADIIWVGGGSLISERFILTAAHIISENKLGRVRYALLGTLNKTDTRSGILCNIVRTIPHKLYEKGEKHHDIALLELNERVKFNEFVRPACLPLTKSDVDNERIIAGWGETGEGGKRGKASEILLRASVWEDESLCSQKFDSLYRADIMICARGAVSPITEDTCKGDSGGPLMALFKNLSCSYSIEGIVSFGPRCGKSAGVYTRVSLFLDWIIDNVWPQEWQSYKELTN